MTRTPTRNELERWIALRPRMTALARRLLADEHGAEDVVQEAWIAALMAPPRDGGALGAWLREVVRTLALQHRRGATRAARREAIAARPETSLAGEELAERLRVQRDVLDAVLELEEPLRSTVHARYFDGLLPGEIAAAQGVSVHTVNDRLKRARRILRETLRRRLGEGEERWSLALLPLAGLEPRAAAALRSPTAAGAAPASLLLPASLLAACVALISLTAGAGPWTRGTRAPIPAPPARVAAVAPVADVATEPDAPARRAVAASGPRRASAAPTPPQDEEPQAAEFRGRIVDATGAPVAGVVLCKFLSFGEFDGTPPTLPAAQWDGTTDDEGRFHGPVSELQLPQTLHVLDRAGGRGATVVVKEAGDLGDVELAPLVAVTGTVKLVALGEAPGRIGVFLNPKVGGLPGNMWGFLEASATPLAFRFELPAGTPFRLYGSDDVTGLFSSSPISDLLVTRDEDLDVGACELTVPKVARVPFVLRDREGSPVAGARVGTSWSMDPGGSRFPLSSPERSDESGAVSVTEELWSDPGPTTFLAIHEARGLAALARVDLGGELAPVELVLEPAVRVHGQLVVAGEGVAPEFSVAYVLTQEGDRVAQSIDRRGQGAFEVLLPRAVLSLNLYGSGTHDVDLPVAFPDGADELDLGTIELPPTAARGLVGAPAPELTVGAARGVAKDVQPADYAGRYLVIEFWGWW